MGLYRRKGTDQWWCRFQVAGREIRRSTRTTDRRRAEIEERRLRTYHESKAPDPRPAGGGLGTLADLAGIDYEAAMARGVSSAQLESIKKSWARVCDHFGPNARIADVATPEKVAGYLATQRQKRTVRGQSLRHELRAIKRGAALAHERGWLLDPPRRWPTIRSDTPDPKRKGKLHPVDVLNQWLGELDGEARDMAELCLLTGLRAEECRRVRADWLERMATGDYLHVPAWASKSRDERWIGLASRSLVIVQQRALGAAPDASLWSGESHRTAYRLARRRIGYERTIHLRDLRTCWATYGLQIGGDAAAVQASLGHSDLRTTQKYQRSTLERQMAVSEAVAKLLATGTESPAQGVAGSSKSGRGERIRTSDPLTPSQAARLLDHVSTCKHCQESTAKHIDLVENDGTGRHSGLAQAVAR